MLRAGLKLGFKLGCAAHADGAALGLLSLHAASFDRIPFTEMAALLAPLGQTLEGAVFEGPRFRPKNSPFSLISVRAAFLSTARGAGAAPHLTP